MQTGRARGPVFLLAASLPLSGAAPSVGEPGTGGSGRQGCCPHPVRRVCGPDPPRSPPWARVLLALMQIGGP